MSESELNEKFEKFLEKASGIENFFKFIHNLNPIKTWLILILVQSESLRKGLSI
jgi:hypothetical protein